MMSLAILSDCPYKGLTVKRSKTQNSLALYNIEQSGSWDSVGIKIKSCTQGVPYNYNRIPCPVTVQWVSKQDG